MIDSTFTDVIEDHKRLRTELRETARRTSSLVEEIVALREAPPLLGMAEGLIRAHQAAKLDQDGYTLDLIEDALFHVGKRLARECGPRR